MISRSDQWWRGAVIYQVYPRSFQDSNHDGVGDLPGLLNRLDHVASLGADAVWLAPVCPSPMADFGYDIAEYCDIDPIFGTLDDFDRVVERCHRLGLKILIDQVWGHSSERHPWFEASRRDSRSPYSDWYFWADPQPDGMPPNNWLSVFGGSAWSWDPRRRQYYLHHFLASQPKLNLRHPGVRRALFDSARFWLDRGVDGFRLDAVDFWFHDPVLANNPPRPSAGPLPLKPFRMQDHRHDMMHADTLDFLNDIHGLMAEYPGTVTLGEVSSEPGAIARCADYSDARAGRLTMAYCLRLMKSEFSRELFIDAVREARSVPGGAICWGFSNHDVERAISRWRPADHQAEFARLLPALLLSLNGATCIYQGEELGLPEALLPFDALRDPFGLAFYPEFRGRDGSRTPMPWQSGRDGGFSTAVPWLPIPDAHLALAVDRQEADPSSELWAWRNLLKWRSTQPAFRSVGLDLVDLPEPLFGFERWQGEQRLIAIFNFAPRQIRVSLSQLGPCADLEAPGSTARLDDKALTLAPYGYFFGNLMPAVSLAKTHPDLTVWPGFVGTNAG